MKTKLFLGLGLLGGIAAVAAVVLQRDPSRLMQGTDNTMTNMVKSRRH